MSSEQEETETPTPSMRKRIGRLVLYVGLAVLVIDLVSSFLISLVSAYSGSENPMTNYQTLNLFIVVAGILMVFAGLAAVLLPEGPSKDGLWVMKLGPFVR
jgi:uncharacterized membrane protein YidH (DUF202 family)